MKKQTETLKLEINPKSALPVYEQVKQQIKLAVCSGALKEGDRLPSLRDLASMLKVNPNTIVKVYFQLEVEGFIESKAGTGFFVKTLPGRAQAETEALFRQLTEDYLSRIIDLGFGPRDVRAYLDKKTGLPVNKSKSGKEEK